MCSDDCGRGKVAEDGVGKCAGAACQNRTSTGRYLGSRRSDLATSVPFYELRFDPIAVNKKVFDAEVDSLALCLSRFFKDGSKAFYKDKLVGARNRKPRPDRYLLINKRKVNHKELKQIRQFPIFRLGKNKGGFQAIVNDERLQPHVNLAGRTIGYLNESETGRGKAGLGWKRLLKTS